MIRLARIAVLLRATSVESKTSPVDPPQDPPSRGQAETLARLNTCTSEPTTELIDRSTSPSVGGAHYGRKRGKAARIDSLE